MTPVIRQQLSSHPPSTEPENYTALDPTNDRQTTDAITDDRVSGTRRQTNETMDAITDDMVSGPRRQTNETMDAITYDRVSGPRRQTNEIMDVITDDRVSHPHRQTMDAITDDMVSGPRRQTMDAVTEDRVSGPRRQIMNSRSEDRVPGHHRQTMDAITEDTVSGPRRQIMNSRSEDRVPGPHRQTMDAITEDRVSRPHRQTMNSRSEVRVSGPHRRTMGTGAEDMVSGPRRQLIIPAEVTSNSGLAANRAAERGHVRSPRSNTTHSRHRSTGVRRVQQRGSRVTQSVEVNNVASTTSTTRDTSANVCDEITPRMYFGEMRTGGDNRGDCPARVERVNTPSDLHHVFNTTVVIVESDLNENVTPLMHSAHKTSMGSDIDSDEACSESAQIHRAQNKIVRNVGPSSGSDGEEMSLEDHQHVRADGATTGIETRGGARQHISEHLHKMNIDRESDGESQKHIRQQVYKCLHRMKVDGDSGSDASSDLDMLSHSCDRRADFVSLVKAASHTRRDSPKVNCVDRKAISGNRDSGQINSHMAPPRMTEKQQTDVTNWPLKRDPAYTSQVNERLARLTSKTNVLAHVNVALRDGRKLSPTVPNYPTSPGRSNHSYSGRSNHSSPGRSNPTSPRWSNDSYSSRSNHSSPHRSNPISPGRSNHSSPRRSNPISPGRNNHSSPRRSYPVSPGRSNSTSPGRSNPSKVRKVFHDLKYQHKPDHDAKLHFSGVTQLHEGDDSKINCGLSENQTHVRSSPKWIDRTSPGCVTAIKSEDGIGRGAESRKTRKSRAGAIADSGTQDVVVKCRFQDGQTKPPVETELIGQLSEEKQHQCQLATDDSVARHRKPGGCKSLFAGAREPIKIHQSKTEVLHYQIVEEIKDELVHSDDGEQTEGTHMFREQSFDDEKSRRMNSRQKRSPAQKIDQQSCKDDKSHRMGHDWKQSPAQRTYKDRLGSSPPRKTDLNIQREAEHQSSLKVVSNSWHGSPVNKHDGNVHEDRARESTEPDLRIPVSRWKHCRNHTSDVPDEDTDHEVLFHGDDRAHLNQRQPKPDYTVETSGGIASGGTTSAADVGNRNPEGIPSDSNARKKYNMKQARNARVNESSEKLLTDQVPTAKKGTKRHVKQDTFLTFSNKKQRRSLSCPLTREEDKTEGDSGARSQTFGTERKSWLRGKEVGSVYASAESQCTTRVDAAPRIRHKHVTGLDVRTAEVDLTDSPQSVTNCLSTSPDVGSTTNSWIASPDATFVVESTSPSNWQTTGCIERLETSTTPRVARSHQKQSARKRRVHEVFPTKHSRHEAVRSQVCALSTV